MSVSTSKRRLFCFVALIGVLAFAGCGGSQRLAYEKCQAHDGVDFIDDNVFTLGDFAVCNDKTVVDIR